MHLRSEDAPVPHVFIPYWWQVPLPTKNHTMHTPFFKNFSPTPRKPPLIPQSHKYLLTRGQCEQVSQNLREIVPPSSVLLTVSSDILGEG
jgi:hypothetical protein